MSKAQFGMVGLGTMGRNFLLNVAEHEFSCVGYDLDETKRKLLIDEGRELPVSSADSPAAFAAALENPRKIMMLVPAGSIVDSVIHDLLPHLEKGDLLIDGGNSHFTDTERREAMLAEKGIAFLGVGVSGGEEGARHGASIMVGGNPAVYEYVRPVFEAASAKVNSEPCAAHVGRGSAGHFVKMVHNGIEYGMMQLIAETYDILRKSRVSSPHVSKGSATSLDDTARTSDTAIADIFAVWNKSELNSFLIEITATVLKKIDEKTGKPLVDMILDTAGQKGTGKWTSQAAMDFGVPIPTIDSAVSMRQISAQKTLRITLAEKLSTINYQLSTEINIDDLRAALYCAFVLTYTQGLSLLQAASEEKAYELDITEIAKIWRGGCIIRSKLLENIRAAYSANPKLPSLLLDEKLLAVVKDKADSFRKVVGMFVTNGVPGMCFSASLAYFDAFRTERLPANLIQAQRDYFGAHTYLRLDKEGIFHTPDWEA